MNAKKLTAVLLAAALSAVSFTGCGINKNATAASMNGATVSLGLANFMCRYTQADYENMYLQYFGQDVWATSTDDTLGDDVKDSTMTTLHEMYTLADADHMEEYGVELSDEENEAITEAAETFMDVNPEDTLNEMGADQDIVEEMLRLYTIRYKMHEAIIATADTEVSDEEANMRAYSMVSVETAEDTESEEGTEVTETVSNEELMKELSSEVESGTDMETAAESLGLSVTTGTYDADDTSLNTDVKDALDSLKEGEYSDLITTDDMIYLVRLDSECDEDATESNRESIIATRQSDKYDEVLSGWQDGDGWKVNKLQIAKIKFKNLFSEQTMESTTEE